MAKLNNKSKPLSHQFFNAQIKPSSRMRLILCIIAFVVSVVFITISLVGSFSYTPLENGIHATGKVSRVEAGTEIYPDFAPRSEFKNYSYETALVNYSLDGENYFVSFAEPIITRKVHNGENIKILIDPDDHTQAIADVFPVPYNWLELSIFGLLALAASIFGFREVTKMKAAAIKRRKGQGTKKVKS